MLSAFFVLSIYCSRLFTPCQPSLVKKRGNFFFLRPAADGSRYDRRSRLPNQPQRFRIPTQQQLTRSNAQSRRRGGKSSPGTVKSQKSLRKFFVCGQRRRSRPVRFSVKPQRVHFPLAAAPADHQIEIRANAPRFHPVAAAERTNLQVLQRHPIPTSDF